MGGETTLVEQHKKRGDAKQAFLCGGDDFRREMSDFRWILSENRPKVVDL
jgi:hypothetical protein